MIPLSITIPTFNRPESLDRCLRSLILSDIPQIIVIDDHSAPGFKERNAAIVDKIRSELGLKALPVSIEYIYNSTNVGAAESRNAGLRIAQHDFVMLLDDDMALKEGSSLSIIAEDMFHFKDVGIIGVRRTEVSEKTIDPAFYLNNAVADYLSRLLGFVFLNVSGGRRLAEFVPSCMVVRKALLRNVRFDPAYRHTGYRDETDFQQKCKESGLRLLYEPNVTIMHFGAEREGYHSPPLSERIYWKANNHAYYLRRHFGGAKLFWYALAGFIILALYSLPNLSRVIRGFRDGFLKASFGQR